ELPPARVVDRVKKLTEPRRLRRVPEEIATRPGMEKAAQRQREPRMRRGEIEDGGVAELGPADTPLHAVEEPDEVRPAGPVDGRPSPLAQDRQLEIDASDVAERHLLEVEDGRLLAQVRDLEDAAALAVLDQERLVALAAESDRVAMQVEELRRDRRRLLGGEARRRGRED